MNGLRRVREPRGATASHVAGQTAHVTAEHTEYGVAERVADEGVVSPSDQPWTARSTDVPDAAGHDRDIAASRRVRGRRAWSAVRGGRLLAVLIVAGALAAWQALTAVMHLESWLLPSPLDVAAAFTQADTQNLIMSNLWPTIEEAAIGFVLCVLVGVVLAMTMTASRVARDGLYPLLIASQAVPTIAIAAVLVVIFGYGLAPKVVVVVLFSFFAVTVNLYDALHKLDPELPGLLRTLGASRWDVLRTAQLPAALPGLFTGVKLAITYSISAAVYSEWVGSTSGLGYALLQAKSQFAAPAVFAIVVVMAALGLAGFGLVAVAERVCVPWASRTTP